MSHHASCPTKNAYAPPHLPHIPEVQGLRAIAVLLVVLCHAGLGGFSGGFIGVDLFFVISGFLITGQLLREAEQQNRIDFPAFFARRLRRLLPSLAVVILSSMLAAYLLLPTEQAERLLRSSPFASSWTSNFHFAFLEHDYFDAFAERDLFQHSWSLAVEEQFYLVWPAVLLILLNLSQRTRISVLLPGLAVLAALSLAGCIWVSNLQPMQAFYQMPFRIWQFAMGAIVFIQAHKRMQSAPARRTCRRILLTVGLLLIALGSLTLNEQIVYPGAWALLPTVAAALILWAVTHSRAHSLLGSVLLTWIGDRSYAIYLWHWPVLVMAFALGLPANPSALTYCLMFTLLLAALSYRLIELPCWKGRLSKASPRLSLLLGLLCMAGLVALSQHLPTPQSSAPRPQDLASRIRQDVPPLYARNCDSSYRSADLNPCEFSSGSPAKTVVLIGDSIGVQWFSAISALYPTPEWKIIVLTKSSCPIVDQPVFNQNGTPFKNCLEWRNSAIQHIQSIEPEAIFLGSAINYGYNAEQWKTGIQSILKKLTHRTQSITAIVGTPELSFDAPSCINRKQNLEIQLTEECSERHDQARSDTITLAFEKAAKEFNNVTVLDFSRDICPNGVCQALTGAGKPIFRDTIHLTDSFIKSFTPTFKEKLKSKQLYKSQLLQKTQK